MNEHLKTGPQGFRLIKEFELAPKGWPQTPEGAALLAYLCPSGQWTLWFGCCFHEDGTPVKEGDEIFDPAKGDRMLAYCVKDAEDYVKRWVTVPLNQYQFDALVSFRFNTRESTLRGSSRLLPAINAGEWDRAAVAFTEFVYGTTTYKGPNDSAARTYQKALRGLLRRRLWEALIFLGLDPEIAVKDDDVALPSDRKLMASGIYRDSIRPGEATTLQQVRDVARHHPLPAPELLLTTPPSPPATAAEAAQRQPVPAKAPAAGAASHVNETAKTSHEAPVAVKIPASVDTKPAAASPAAAPAARAGVTQPSPPPIPKAAPAPVPAVVPTPVGTKPKSPNTVAPTEVPYRIDTNAGLKPLEESDRAKGYWYQQAGIGMIRLGSLGVFGTTVQGGAQVLQGDPVLSNLVLTGVVVGGIAVTGYVVKVYGDWRRKRGERAAVQGLY